MCETEKNRSTTKRLFRVLQCCRASKIQDYDANRTFRLWNPDRCVLALWYLRYQQMQSEGQLKRPVFAVGHGGGHGGAGGAGLDSEDVDAFAIDAVAQAG